MVSWQRSSGRGAHFRLLRGSIVGVVVLLKDGSDRATNEAASAAVDVLRSAGVSSSSVGVSATVPPLT